MNQDRMMQLIRKNLAAVAASQRQSKARGESIDQQMKEISTEQKRIARGLGQGIRTLERGQNGRKKR